MLLYKINEDKVGSRSGDYTYMLNLIKEDYRNYCRKIYYRPKLSTQNRCQ